MFHTTIEIKNVGITEAAMGGAQRLFDMNTEKLAMSFTENLEILTLLLGKHLETVLCTAIFM